jgi:lysyl-tRNA synthetase class I
MCILNALAVVAGNKEMVKVASRIIVNTDCLNAIHIFNRDQVKIKKYKLRQMTGYASMYFQKYKPIFGKVNVEFRHVQAHTDKDDARSHVNKKMDNAAKAEMKLLLNKSNPDTNENSPNPNGNQLRGRSNDPAAKRQAQQA